MTVALNSEATISRTIESVMNQSYKNIEYIIIDGASSDNTVSVAKSYIEKFSAIPGRSMKVISEPDKGMYDALNKGARLACGTIVGQINADDWYEPYAVQTMADLYEHEKYNVAWGSLRVKTKKADIIKHAKYTRGGGGLKLWTTSHWNHTSMFTERKILLEYPYACENMFDDWEFITRCHVNGKKLVAIDKIISNFTFGGMSTRKSLKDVIQKVNFSYATYKRYNFSRLYWLQRFVCEMIKYIMA